jgi:hypothetical protein
VSKIIAPGDNAAHFLPTTGEGQHQWAAGAGAVVFFEGRQLGV